MDLNDLIRRCHAASVKNGKWKSRAWTKSQLSVQALNDEVQEFQDAIHWGSMTAPSEKIPDFTHVEEELADIVIVAMSIAGQFKLNLWSAVIAKMEVNEQ